MFTCTTWWVHHWQRRVWGLQDRWREELYTGEECSLCMGESLGLSPPTYTAIERECEPGYLVVNYPLSLKWNESSLVVLFMGLSTLRYSVAMGQGLHCWWCVCTVLIHSVGPYFNSDSFGVLFDNKVVLHSKLSSHVNIVNTGCINYLNALYPYALACQYGYSILSTWLGLRHLWHCP